MHRALVSGVTACLLLLVAPGHSAAGVTHTANRTAPYDYGTTCLPQDVHGGFGPVGSPVPPACYPVPDPSAMGGRLRTGQETVHVGAGVQVVSTGPPGGFLEGTAGRRWSATGITVHNVWGYRAQATATLSGLTGNGFVCVTIYEAGSPIPRGRSCGRGASLTASAPANLDSDYTFDVTLNDAAGDGVFAPSPCAPNGVVTCYSSVWTMPTEGSVTVDSISYSFSV